MERYLTTLDRNQGHSGHKNVNEQHSMTTICVHKPNLGFLCQIIEDYARDTIFLGLMAEVKIGYRAHYHTNFGITTSNNIGDMLRI